VIVESRDQCGRGGHTAVGAPVTVKATRAWTLPPQQKQEWHQQHRENSAKAEVPFKDRHPEQVQKVQAREKAAPPKTPAPHGNSKGVDPHAAPSKPGAAPAEKPPPEGHAQPEKGKKTPAQEEHEKKGEKERDK
jgi:hypothetical protein